MAVVRDMEEHAVGQVATGSWDIRHFLDGIEWAGPLDEGAKLNINTATRVQLLNLPGMTPDVVDAIVDWRDDNDEVEGLGAERDYYSNRSLGYRPRNGSFRSIAELELVAGAWPENVRGEDWNLNGRLDPNEDDSTRSFPKDKPDGKLDAGWSSFLTARSKQSQTSSAGETKLPLKGADAESLTKRLGVSAEQAQAIVTYGNQANARPEAFLSTPLSQLAAGGGAASGASTGSTRGGSGGSASVAGASGGKSPTGSGQSATSGRSSAGRTAGATGGSGVPDLTPEQVRAVVRELTIDDFTKPVPGRMNINTVPEAVLKEVLDMDPRMADAIIARRKSRPEGIASLADLASMSGMNPQVLSQVATQFDVTSSVYTVTSRGRAASTGTEVEVEAVLDKSEFPVRITTYREQ